MFILIRISSWRLLKRAGWQLIWESNPPLPNQVFGSTLTTALMASTPSASFVFLRDRRSNTRCPAAAVAGRIVTPDRNRLAPEMVEDLVTMKCNLRLLRNLPSVWAFHMCHLDQPEIYLPIIVESGFQKFKRIQFSLGRWNAQIGDETCQLSRGTCQNFSPSLLSPWESLSSRSSGDLCKMDQTDLYFSWRLISYFSALIWTNLTTALLDRVIISY